MFELIRNLKLYAMIVVALEVQTFVCGVDMFHLFLRGVMVVYEKR